MLNKALCGNHWSVDRDLSITWIFNHVDFQSRGTFKLMNYHSAYHLPDIGFWEKVDRLTHCSDPSRISILQCASVCQTKPAEESNFYETLLNMTLYLFPAAKLR